MKVRIRSLAPEDVALLAAMLLLPWAFGGVESWAWRPAAGLVGVAAGIAIARRGWAGLGLLPGSGWLLPLALIVLWLCFQSLPLPRALVGVLSPAAATTWDKAARELEADALAHLPPNLPPAPAAPTPPPRLAADTSCWSTLSLTPSRTRENAIWLAAIALAWMLTRRRTADSDVAAIYRCAWFALAGALSAQGLLQLAAGNAKLLGLRATEVGRPFGSFVNGTNFCSLMEIAVPWLIGYAAMRWRRNQRLDPRIAAALATATLAFAAGLATQSRTGSVLLIAGVTLTLAVVARGWRERAVLLAGAGITIAVGAIAIALSPLAGRFRDAIASGEYFDPDRIAVWKVTLTMIRDFPVAGVGVGAYGHVFRRYVPAGGYDVWWQAHNDWLEWIAITGIVGAVLLAWLLAGSVRSCQRQHK